MRIDTTLVATIFTISAFFSCNNETHTNEAIKETPHQEMRDTIVQKEKINVRHPENLKKKKRALRYLFFANGGIQAFFDDGTIVGCPKCEFCRSNIIQMFKEKPFETYTVESDGSLLINGNDREIPTYNGTADDGWALIDYKWHIRPPQY